MLQVRLLKCTNVKCQLLPYDLIPSHSSYCAGFLLFAFDEVIISWPAFDFRIPTIASWPVRIIVTPSARLTMSQMQGYTPSPARMSSTIGRLPDVMYLTDTPRATSGWARSSFS
jgi:hypothetical protein